MKKIILLLLVLIIAIGGYIGFNYYQKIYAPAVISSEYKVLYISSNWDYKTLLMALKDSVWLESASNFDWVAQQKNYPKRVKPGKYKIEANWNNAQIIDRLRSGEQIPVKVTFNNQRTIAQLAGAVSKYLEADSVEFLNYFIDNKTVGKYGFNKATFPALFIPNTYQFFWNTSPEKFVNRMAQEFKIFWNTKRKAKATKLNLTQSEVVTLASIVEEETKMNDEKPQVAGVYLNRLRKNMLLQADPTLIFGIGDFSIRRVLNIHKKINSPYNTYLNKGLPPGPIRIPEISSVDAVLNPQNHMFLYFCAKEDFSGYHNFATNYRDHINNARRYQQALNERKIYN